MILDVVLVTMLLICMFTDFRTRRIPNKVVLPAMVFGLIWNTMWHESHGFLFSLAGLAMGAALFLIPFVLGGLGAGDVKLLAAVGALKGAAFVFAAFLGTGVVGGLITVIILLKEKKTLATLKRIGLCLYILAATRFRINGLDTLERKEFATAFPYGLAIGIGSLGALIFGWQSLLNW